MGIHSANRFEALALGCGFLPADVISHKKRRRQSLFLALTLVWMIGAEQVTCCWCSFPSGRITVAMSKLSFISECAPLLLLLYI